MFVEKLNEGEEDEISSSEEDYKDNSKSSSEEDCNLLFPYFEFTDNSMLYVVSVDDKPVFYVKDEKSAKEKMWSLVRYLTTRHFTVGYRTNYLEINEKELHLIGSYRFFLIAYDQILHRIKYCKIPECI